MSNLGVFTYTPDTANDTIKMRIFERQSCSLEAWSSASPSFKAPVSPRDCPDASASVLRSPSRELSGAITFSFFPEPCKTLSINAEAVPLGNRSFSRTMTSFRSGTANTTPKRQTPRLQITNFQKPSFKGPPSPSPPSPLGPSSPGFSRNSKAGMTPTNPHPRGMVPTAPATVCIKTFSTGVKGKDRYLG